MSEHIRLIRTRRRRSRAGRITRSAAVVSLLLLAARGAAAEPSITERIATGDTPAEVINKLKSEPTSMETIRLLGMPYEVMTFGSGLSTIRVRFLFGHVVTVETSAASLFGLFK
jgi:hypothetical protein